jgi:hypothetical protein
VEANPPIPGKTDCVHPALIAVHDVIVVPGRVYPAAHARIPSDPFDWGVAKFIQLTPLYELTLNNWVRPTGFATVPPGLPIPCAQCGQLADGVDEWQLFTVSNLVKSVPAEPISPVQT